MFHFSFDGPPANGFFEQMAVQASTLNIQDPECNRARQKKPMSPT